MCSLSLNVTNIYDKIPLSVHPEDAMNISRSMARHGDSISMMMPSVAPLVIMPINQNPVMRQCLTVNDMIKLVKAERLKAIGALYAANSTIKNALEGDGSNYFRAEKVLDSAQKHFDYTDAILTRLLEIRADATRTCSLRT